MEVVCATTGPLVRIDIHRARIFGLIDTSMYVPSCLVTFATIINPKYKGNSLIGLGSQSVSLWQKLPTRTITSDCACGSETSAYFSRSFNHAALPRQPCYCVCPNQPCRR